jgi:hypothetical protein
MTWNERLQELVTNLEQERDELRVKLHLASREAKEEFEAMEGRLDALRARLIDSSADAREAASDVGEVVSETARRVADDLRDGYRKLRDHMSSP